MGVGVRVSRTGTLCASVSGILVLFAAAAGHAQTAASAAPSPPAAQASPQPKPVTGFVSSYEIMRTVRSAGFDALGPPLREGTTYVLRATDYRGILMRVVLDARTGVIRDVTRIVPAEPDAYGMMPPPYGAPPYAPPYGPPPYEGTQPASLSPIAHPAAASMHPFSPPLPRPRPAALAGQNPPKSQSRAGADTGAAGTNAAASSVRAAPGKQPPLAPFND